MHSVLAASFIIVCLFSQCLGDQSIAELTSTLGEIDLKDPDIILQYEHRLNKASRQFTGQVCQSIKTQLGQCSYVVRRFHKDLAFTFDDNNKRIFFLRDNNIIAQDLSGAEQQSQKIIARTATPFNRSSKIAFDQKNQILVVSLNAEYNQKILLFFQEDQSSGSWEKIQSIALDNSSLENLFFDTSTNRCFVVATSNGLKECKIFKWIDGFYRPDQTLVLNLAGGGSRASDKKRQGFVYYNDKAQCLVSVCVSLNHYTKKYAPSVSLYNYQPSIDQYILFQQIFPNHEHAAITAVNYQQKTKMLFIAYQFDQQFSKIETWELIDGALYHAPHKSLACQWGQSTFVEKIILNKNPELISMYCPLDHDNGFVQTRNIRTGKYMAGYCCTGNDVWADDEHLYKFIKHRNGAPEIRIYDRNALHMWDDDKLAKLKLSQLILFWAIKRQTLQNASLHRFLPINAAYGNDYQQIAPLLKIWEIDQIHFTT